MVLGEHYYVPNPLTGTGINPKWDFTSHAYKGQPNAFVVAAKSTGLSAPTGSQDIDWVFLKSVTGDLAAEVYRTDTRLGQPPASVRALDHSRSSLTDIFYSAHHRALKSSRSNTSQNTVSEHVFPPRVIAHDGVSYRAFRRISQEVGTFRVASCSSNTSTRRICHLPNRPILEADLIIC